MSWTRNDETGRSRSFQDASKGILWVAFLGLVVAGALSSRGASAETEGAAAETRAQGAGRRIFEGTVTWFDAARKLVVLQEGTNVSAVRVDLPQADFQQGERVVLDGEASPLIPAFPDYPGKPTSWGILSSFEAATNGGEYYLARARGFLHPPVTGNYTFWIASDDSSELWLSEDGDEEKARRIAFVGIGRWTEPRQWTRSPSQQSSEVWLEAGRAYYIEALHQQNTGMDCLAVAWQGPGIERAVIGGRYLSPGVSPGDRPVLAMVSGSTNGILREYWKDFFSADLASLRKSDAFILNAWQARLLERQKGRLPKPVRIPAEETPGPEENFRWVELDGYARYAGSAGRELDLEVKDGHARIRVKIGGNEVGPFSFPENSLVRVRGVYESVAGPNKELPAGILWVSGTTNIHWRDTPENWSRLEATPIHLLARTNFGLESGKWVRTRGRVIRQESPGVWSLQGEDSFEGYTSSDGTHWESIGPLAECAMSNSVLVGFAVSSHQTGDVAVVEFDHVTGLSGSLRGSDIGGPKVPGGFESQGGSYKVRGCGQDIWWLSDQCYFAWQLMEGGGEIVANVASFKSADPQAKAAIMVRESLAPDSVWAGMVLTPGHRVGLQTRPETGKAATGVLMTRAVDWLKVVRHRNRLFISTEGGERGLTGDGAGSPSPATNSVSLTQAGNRGGREEPRAGQQLEVMGTVAWKDGSPLLAGVRRRTMGTNAGMARRAAPRGSTQPSVGEYHDVRIKELVSSEAEARQAGYLARCRIHGVVTFNGTVSGEPSFFVQDETAGCTVRFGRRMSRESFHTGQLVEITGSVSATNVALEFIANGITVAGEGTMPEPLSYPFDPDVTPWRNGQWVEAEGVVRAVNSSGALLLMTRAGILPVWVEGNAPENPRRVASPPIHRDGKGTGGLMDTLVKVRGVYWEGASPMLLAQAKDSIQIKEAAPLDPFDAPVIPTPALNGLRVSDALARRVKVAGVVTCRRDGFFLVQDVSGGIRVESPQWGEVKVGDAVEAVGFPTHRAFGMMLVEGMVRRKGEEKPPGAVQLSVDDLQASNNGLVVEVEALLLEQRMRQGIQILELQDGQRAFRAALPASAGRLPVIALGSRVRITGVSQIESVERLPGETVSGDRPLMASLEVLLRSPADVSVLERPPWWNWEYTAAVIGVIVAGLTASLLWVRMLRRRVEERTHELRETMAKLQKETQISATLAERDRLAGEIHDSLEQGLSAIVMQMEAAAKYVDQPDRVGRYLAMARNMAGFSRTEVQHAVWDLQSPLLQNADLSTALRRIAGEISAGDLPLVTVEISGQARPLPSSVEHHLLRIGQEAITNAVKHGQPKAIRVSLDYGAASVTLAVRDDGCGFELKTAVSGSGHFGLQGLRTRARKLNATLNFSSEPGQGTRIEVVVPLAKHEERGGKTK